MEGLLQVSQNFRIALGRPPIQSLKFNIGDVFL